MSWDKENILQLQLPDPADEDPYPRLLLNRYARLKAHLTKRYVPFFWEHTVISYI